MGLNAIAYVDGGCNNRTKSGGYGSYAIFGKDELIATETFLLNAKTSNQAEYMSLIKLLEFIYNFRKRVKHDSHWTIYSDSKLTVNQVANGWKVNEPVLKELNAVAKELYQGLNGHVKLIWTPRKNIVDILGH